MEPFEVSSLYHLVSQHCKLVKWSPLECKLMAQSTLLMTMVSSCGMKFRKEIICDFTHLHSALNTVAFVGHSLIGHVVC